MTHHDSLKLQEPGIAIGVITESPANGYRWQRRWWFGLWPYKVLQAAFHQEQCSAGAGKVPQHKIVWRDVEVEDEE